MSYIRLDRHGFLKPSKNNKLLISPNQSDRPEGTQPTLLVIHNISLPPNQFGGPYIKQLFTNRLQTHAHPFFNTIKDLKVSAHFLITRQGQIIQFVSTNKVAWHAGVSTFKGQTACNNFSIGIELEGSDFTPFEDAQYKQLIALTKVLRSRYPLNAVMGHEHIASGRKTDPGPFFNWSMYCRKANWFFRQSPLALR